MSEFLKDPSKQDQLKEIVKRLHKGAKVKDLKKDFARLLKDLSAEEIASMEQSLVDEGFPPSSIQDLCEVHVEVFEDSLKNAKEEAQIAGHPVHTYKAENREAEKRLKELEGLLKKAKKSGRKELKEVQRNTLLAKIEDLLLFEKHYQRKENQLFSKLEAAGFTGPTTVMWGKHDEIREVWKALRKAAESKALPADMWESFKVLKKKMNKMIFMEEKILFPTSLKKLNPADWAAVRNEEGEIGYSWVCPGSMWDPSVVLKKYAREQAAEKGVTGPDIKEYLTDPKAEPPVRLSEGLLTRDQIDIMLKNLPFDITFVDENDKVRYYSATDDRVFPRTPSIIGRDVQKCHPPESVDVVEKIVVAFKNRERDKAEFWLTLQGRVIFIRYFPVFDEQDNYRGVIEVSQDITEIRKITGEQRLLDWE